MLLKNLQFHIRHDQESSVCSFNMTASPLFIFQLGRLCLLENTINTSPYCVELFCVKT